MYTIRIELNDGQIITATVTKATLRGLKMFACRSIKWEKQS
jgi:molybdopterin-binding protein